jgi:hypothetical protein
MAPRKIALWATAMPTIPTVFGAFGSSPTDSIEGGRFEDLQRFQK